MLSFTQAVPVVWHAAFIGFGLGLGLLTARTLYAFIEATCDLLWSLLLWLVVWVATRRFPLFVMVAAAVALLLAVNWASLQDLALPAHLVAG